MNIQGIENNYMQFNGAQFRGLVWSNILYVSKTALNVLPNLPLAVPIISYSLNMYEDRMLRNSYQIQTYGGLGADMSSHFLNSAAAQYNARASATIGMINKQASYSFNGTFYLPNSWFYDRASGYSRTATRIGNIGANIGYASTSIGMASDFANVLNEIGYFHNLDVNIRLNLISSYGNEQLLESRLMQKLLTVGAIKDRDYLARYGQKPTNLERTLEIYYPLKGSKPWHDVPTKTQFAFNAAIAPLSDEGILYNRSLNLQSLIKNQRAYAVPSSSLSNVQWSTSIVNNYIGGATNRMGEISRTLDVIEIGYRPISNTNMSHWIYTPAVSRPAYFPKFPAVKY
jgi:hypothetical protein